MGELSENALAAIQRSKELQPRIEGRDFTGTAEELVRKIGRALVLIMVEGEDSDAQADVLTTAMDELEPLL